MNIQPPYQQRPKTKGAQAEVKVADGASLTLIPNYYASVINKQINEKAKEYYRGTLPKPKLSYLDRRNNSCDFAID